MPIRQGSWTIRSGAAMKNSYLLRHRLAVLNPYHSVVKALDADPEKYLIGVKNTASVPSRLVRQLEAGGFSLHTIDKKSGLAGRAVDLDLVNPITGRIMSGSSSGTAINVFAGINDLGIGTDGGGSVLAPAISVNIIGFISRLIAPDARPEAELKPNTDGIASRYSIGFMARQRDVLYRAIRVSMGAAPAEAYGTVYSDREYPGINSRVVPMMDALAPRKELAPFLKEKLAACDVMMVTEGPVDLEGFGDSLFGHFDERTKKIQEASRKGYVRVCNIAGATALALPQKGLGMSTLLMCESRREKVERLLRLAESIPPVRDELIERYFLDLQNYFLDGYQYEGGEQI